MGKKIGHTNHKNYLNNIFRQLFLRKYSRHGPTWNMEQWNNMEVVELSKSQNNNYMNA